MVGLLFVYPSFCLILISLPSVPCCQHSRIVYLSKYTTMVVRHTVNLWYLYLYVLLADTVDWSHLICRSVQCDRSCWQQQWVPNFCCQKEPEHTELTLDELSQPYSAHQIQLHLWKVKHHLTQNHLHLLTNIIQQCFSIFLLQRNPKQAWRSLMEPPCIDLWDQRRRRGWSYGLISLARQSPYGNDKQA